MASNILNSSQHFNVGVKGRKNLNNTGYILNDSDRQGTDYSTMFRGFMEVGSKFFEISLWYLALSERVNGLADIYIYPFIQFFNREIYDSTLFHYPNSDPRAWVYYHGFRIMNWNLGTPDEISIMARINFDGVKVYVEQSFEIDIKKDYGEIVSTDDGSTKYKQYISRGELHKVSDYGVIFNKSKTLVSFDCYSPLPMTAGDPK